MKKTLGTDVSRDSSPVHRFGVTAPPGVLQHHRCRTRTVVPYLIFKPGSHLCWAPEKMAAGPLAQPQGQRRGGQEAKTGGWGVGTRPFPTADRPCHGSGVSRHKRELLRRIPRGTEATSPRLAAARQPPPRAGERRRGGKCVAPTASRAALYGTLLRHCRAAAARRANGEPCPPEGAAKRGRGGTREESSGAGGARCGGGRSPRSTPASRSSRARAVSLGLVSTGDPGRAGAAGAQAQ